MLSVASRMMYLSILNLFCPTSNLKTKKKRTRSRSLTECRTKKNLKEKTDGSKSSKHNLEWLMKSLLELSIVLSVASVLWIKSSMNKTLATASTRQLYKNSKKPVKTKSRESIKKREAWTDLPTVVQDRVILTEITWKIPGQTKDGLSPQTRKPTIITTYI